MNYKEETITGTSWIRCNRVELLNQLNGIKQIFFQEEKVVNVGDTPITSHSGACTTSYDPNAVIPLLDANGQDTGSTFTHDTLYAMLYSLYMRTATQRDAAQASQV
jgi:hypothetical protein